MSAAAVLDRAKINQLASIAAEITDSASRGDVIGYLDADRRFHVEIVSAVGNQRLTDLVDRLRRQTRLSGLTDLARAGGSPHRPMSTTRSWLRWKSATRMPLPG